VGGISIALVPPTVCLLSWGSLRAGCRRGDMVGDCDEGLWRAE